MMRLSVLFVIAVVLLASFKSYELVLSHRASAIPEIKSGITGYCLDDHRDGKANNTTVDAWSCNGTAAQDWVASDNTIRHDGNSCLSVQTYDNSGSTIVSHACNGSAGQTWVSAIDGYENPGTAKCLEVPGSQTGAQLALGSCDSLTEPDEAWMPSTWSAGNTAGASTSCNGLEGERIACEAAKQWVIWQSGSVSHKTLLNAYSDGNGYEEWCADFVSYAYKQAGYPFTGGERSGWDEYNANYVQYENLTYHPAAGYTPQPGDVAFFDYPGGHVEIVAIGGSKPVFIYGDSGTTDPTTGNGDMTENSITNDGNLGQVIYYLSPS